MKTTAEKIDVMLAFVNGAKIECMDKDDTAKQFNYVVSPAWDWNGFDYRVMPKKTLEQKIEDKWPGKKVVMFGWSSANIWGWTTGNKTEHIKAQSMRGFHTYVYQRPQDDSLFPDTKAVYCWNEFLTLQPVAVLFEGEE